MKNCVKRCNNKLKIAIMSVIYTTMNIVNAAEGYTYTKGNYDAVMSVAKIVMFIFVPTIFLVGFLNFMNNLKDKSKVSKIVVRTLVIVGLFFVAYYALDVVQYSKIGKYYLK